MSMNFQVSVVFLFVFFAWLNLAAGSTVYCNGLFGSHSRNEKSALHGKVLASAQLRGFEISVVMANDRYLTVLRTENGLQEVIAQESKDYPPSFGAPDDVIGKVVLSPNGKWLAVEFEKHLVAMDLTRLDQPKTYGNHFSQILLKKREHYRNREFRNIEFSRQGNRLLVFSEIYGPELMIFELNWMGQFEGKEWNQVEINHEHFWFGRIVPEPPKIRSVHFSPENENQLAIEYDHDPISNPSSK